MSDGGPTPLTSRLDRLFKISRPRGRQWSNAEVAAEVKKANPDLRVSGAYLSMLRTGKRTSPSTDLLVALARFFGVNPSYFFDDEDGQGERVRRQLEQLEMLRERGVVGIAQRAVGLPQANLDLIIAMLDQARRQQGLPPVTDVAQD
ncbi:MULTISPECIES: helix-turn-helix domain-containing protein [Actinokineospora]|uniref:XRE family transcriptional regulator n=1 Tax=Actinokineospora fastidiosa TaxID=1816 RepID=A0A918LC78_9PSEU|nr:MULTISPECIES: helix-turn-helix domain-containing protein [Actinokineospora]UVS79761.1 Nucleoid-associated protein EspR [Actinokineospora sp. UTMC 2448]GGS30784.1 XRE family transcriptional regulator [Actinokineospora fastidiosa]